MMALREAEAGKEYIIRDIRTDDEEMNAFLFSLGCYSGEPITVIKRRKSGCVVSIKDGRYKVCIFLSVLSCFFSVTWSICYVLRNVTALS